MFQLRSPKVNIQSGKSATAQSSPEWLLDQRVNLSFENLEYKVPTTWRRKEFKVLLKGVSGCFRGGELTALMGPSGAGKSTLTNVLAGYKTRNMSAGKIQVNGANRDLGQFRRLSCYIMQSDELLPQLTVMESMLVAANLKLSGVISKTEKINKVNEILDALGLSEHKDTKAVNLSGGQRKRLSIAHELVNNPPLMFFDEPTSGLDSQSCYQCISLLKSLAEEGRTITCTIHQPSAKLFNMFDKLYFLVGGVCIYQGPIATLVPYLKTQGLECPSYHNPADFMIEVSCGEYGDVNERLAKCVKSGESEKIIANIASSLSSERLPIQKEQPIEKAPTDVEPTVEPAVPTEETAAPKSSKKKVFKQKAKRVFAANTFTQFVVLFVRTFRCIIRDSNLTHMRFLSHVVIGVMIGGLYLNVGNDGTKRMENLSSCFFTLMFIMFGALMPTVMTFPLEMSVFVREHLNDWYSLRSYYFAKAVADIPFQLIFPITYTTIIYFMTDQPLDAERYALFLVFSILIALTAQSLGLVISVSAPLQLAVYLGPVSSIPIVMFSGFFIKFDAIPGFFSWMSYFSYVRYAYEGMVVSLYGFGREEIPCQNTTTIIDRICESDPKRVLESLDMQESRQPFDAAMLLVFFVGFRIICYIVLRIRVRLLSVS